MFQSVDGGLIFLLVGSENQPSVGPGPWNFAGGVAPVLDGVDGGMSWHGLIDKLKRKIMSVYFYSVF